MKKLIAFASAATLGLTLAACGDGRDDTLQDDPMMTEPGMTGADPMAPGVTDPMAPGTTDPIAPGATDPMAPGATTDDTMTEGAPGQM
jgi:hypothetical protein